MSPDPTSIRVEHELFMRSFFAISPPQRVTRQITASVRDVYFEPGEVVFEANTPPRVLYFVVDGEVDMAEPHEDASAWTFGPMSLIGIVDANLGRPHARTARAKTDLHLLGIQVEDFFDILEDNFDFARAMLLDAYSATWERTLQLSAEHVFPHDPKRTAERPWTAVQKLNTVQRLMVLRSSRFTGGGPVQPLVVLAGQIRELRLSAGDVFVETGGRLDAVWIVADGLLTAEHIVGPSGLGASESRWAAQVAALRTWTTGRIEGRFGPGELVLATAALPAPVSPLQVKAERDTVALGVPKEALWDTMEDHFGLFRRALAYVSRENERIRLRRSELASRDLEATG